MQYRQDMVGGGSLGGAAAMFALNFIIGGFVLVWRLLVAMWYVSLTIYRLIVGYAPSSPYKIGRIRSC